MRKNFIEKYDYYRFLKDLSQLPDSCSSLPFYFENYEFIDVFVTFYRTNNPLSILCSIFRKASSRRNSFSNTFLCYSFNFDIEIMKMLFLDSDIRTVKDMFDRITFGDSTIKSLFDDLIDLDLNEKHNLKC